jgi:hypothetical protein
MQEEKSCEIEEEAQRLLDSLQINPDSDYRDVFLREVQGFQTDSDKKPVFRDYKIDLLRTNTSIYSTYHEPKYIFITVDPSAGGNRSKTALFSCFFEGGCMVVSN